jgi:hypothetical protein
MRGGGAEADVIGMAMRLASAKKIAVAQSVRPLLRRDEQILSPTRPFEPAFVAQRFNDMVGRLGGYAEQLTISARVVSRWPRSLRASTTRLS